MVALGFSFLSLLKTRPFRHELHELHEFSLENFAF